MRKSSWFLVPLVAGLMLISFWFWFPVPSLADSFASIRDGDWNDNCTWSFFCWGSTPGASDDVIISSGTIVSLSQDESVHHIDIKGPGFLFPAGKLQLSSYTLTVYGHWNNDGDFDAGSGTVVFANAGVQNISGDETTVFYNMVIESTSTVVVPVTNQPQADNDVDNQGVLRQVRDVNGNTSFLNIQSSGGADRYFGMDLNGSVGTTQVDIDGYQDACPNVPSGSHPVKRCYAITPDASGTVAATFYYEYGELRASEGQDPATLYVWQDNGDGTWTKITPDTRSSCSSGDINCSVTVNSLALASGTNRYVLANYNPQAVEMAAFEAAWTPGGVLVSWETVSEFDLLGFNLYRAEAESGPWTQVNKALILSPSPGSPEGRAYSWLDAEAPTGSDAYYRLEWVMTDGSTAVAGQLHVVDTRPQFPHRSWLPMLW